MEEISILEEAINIVGGEVSSVNGKTGDVVLNAADVGATTTSEVNTIVNASIAQAKSQIEAEIPTKTSELTNDSNFQNSTQVNTAITNATTPINTKVNSIDTAINKTVVSNVTITGSASTDTLSLDSGKVNIKTGATSSATVPFPVASATTAGVMNAATFQGLQQTTDIANGLLEGAVAINNLPTSPTQAQLTSAWKTATGRTTLMNRAVVYDVTNQKLWTYYDNTETWYPVTAGGGSVDVQPWTNTQAGIVKGSTTDGQIFAESDGTGSVNGWDEVKTDIENLEQAGYQTETDVRDIISGTNVSDLADGNNYATTASVNEGLATKQNTISDLDTIRSGAASGATAVQPEDLGTLATKDTVDYETDVTNKPTIPTVGNGTITITQGGVSKGTFTTNQGSNTTIALDSGGSTNFNTLTNRPSYNGVAMTNATNIPEVKTSAWDDKSTVSVSATGTATDEISYITVDGVEKKIAGGGGGGAVNSVNGFTGDVVLYTAGTTDLTEDVSELDAGKLYFVYED